MYLGTIIDPPDTVPQYLPQYGTYGTYGTAVPTVLRYVHWVRHADVGIYVSPCLRSGLRRQIPQTRE